MRSAVAGAALGAIMIGSGPGWSGNAPTGGISTSRGFVLTNVYWESDNQADACPSQTLSALDVYLRSLPASERAQYEQPGKPGFSAPEQRQELTRRFQAAMGFKRLRISGPNQPMGGGIERFAPEEIARFQRQLGLGAGKGDLAFLNTRFDYDSCTDPEDFPSLAKGLVLYEGPVAAGLNLDGVASPEDFTGPDGGKGVDNQLWRLLGCIWSARDNANPQEAAARVMSGLAPTLVELTGIDDIHDDDHVDIAIHISADPIVLSANGKPIHGVSYSPLPAPSLHSSGRGRIVDGVLVSEPMDIRISYREQILDTTRDLHQARLRMVFMEDGSVEGQIAGYQTIDSIWAQYKQSTQAAADQTGYSCPAIYAALPRLADGLPDPATGENQGLSAAFRYVGVPAFVVPSSAVPGDNAPVEASRPGGEQ